MKLKLPLLFLSLMLSLPATASNFVAISDVHLDPFDKSPKYPDTSKDSNTYYLERIIGSVAYLESPKFSTIDRLYLI